VKRFRLLKATSLLLLTMVVAGIILDEVRTRIRRHYGDRYQRDVADFREQAAAYRRPMLFGAPLDDNAAAWYQQSFPHFSTESVRQLGDVIRGGFSQYSETATAAIEGICAEADSPRVGSALRCSRCDWGLSPDTTTLEHPLQARVLGQCLAMLGYREAFHGRRRAAFRRYFASLAFACDVGRGDDVMTLIGMISADGALRAIAELVVSIDDDRAALDDVLRQLSQFEGSLPIGRSALLRDRLLADKLALNRTNSWRMLTHWQLGTRRNLLTQMTDLATSLQTNDQSARLDEIERQATTNHENARTARERLFAETTDLERYVALLKSTSQMVRVFRAVQTVIVLQVWRMEHHRYPATEEELGQPLDRFGIKYESAKNGDRYKLIDLHPWNAKFAVLIEHPSRRVEN